MKPPRYHPKQSNEEVRQLEHLRTRPNCGHFWNYKKGMVICSPCLSAWRAENARKRSIHESYRGFYRAINPIISRADLKRMEAEAGEKIIIRFKLAGKRGKAYELHISPNLADVGGVNLDLFDGNPFADGKLIAYATITTGEFAAVGALITNPEIIPHA